MYKILLVEDDPLVAALVSELLTEEGYAVSRSETGRESLQLVKSEPPDLIILDLHLPDMDGLAVCSEVRQVSRLPILILSSRNEDVDKIAGIDMGADDYLGKPFNAKELLARVRAQLRRWRQWQAPPKTEPSPDQSVVTRHASVLFADIWNYGALLASRPLDEFVDQVSEYYELVERVLTQHLGVFNNNLGESLVAVFAGPQDSNAALCAARAAQQIHHEVDRLNLDWVRNGRLPLGLGIGIHSAEMVLGDVSLRGEAEFTLIGKQARLAASIERFTRKLNAKILLSEEAAASVKGSLELTARGSFPIETGELTEVYELSP